MRTTPLLRCSSGTSKLTSSAQEELLSRWRTLASAKPTAHTQEALALLQTTISMATASSDGDVSPSPSTLARTALLKNRDASRLIWKTLRRQRVPWQAAAALAAEQLACVSPAQRRLITASTQGRPWAFSHAVLAAWDAQDPSLAGVYRRLKACRTAVEMAQAVSAELRGRPELGRVLPVTAAVLRHAYALGMGLGAGRDARRKASVCVPGPDRSNAAAEVALELSHHLALIGADALSVREKEALTLNFALLHGRTGNWATALKLVTTSSVVRLSTKDGLATYVRQREYYLRGVDLEASLVPVAIEHAPSWADALALLLKHPAVDDDARLAFLKRTDVSAAAAASEARAGREASGCANATLTPTASSIPWPTTLDIFAQLAPARQSYGVLRPLLERVPHSLPEYILVCLKALRPVAARMYAGTLTRRVHTLTRRGEVAAAVALCCAAGYYDLAALLVPRLELVPEKNSGRSDEDSRGGCRGKYALPTELLCFSKVSTSLRAPRAVHQSLLQLSPNAGLAELLAHTLCGDWRVVEAQRQSVVTEAQTGNGGWDRLDVLLAARRSIANATPTSPSATAGEEIADEDEASALMPATRAGCYTFASSTVSRLVCARAAESSRRYFAKVIPRALHAHHFGAEAVQTAGGSTTATCGHGTNTHGNIDGFGEPSAKQRADDILRFIYLPDLAFTVETLDDCHWLIRAIQKHLRTSASTATRPHSQLRSLSDANEDHLLRLVARACASGRVRLRASDSFGMALAVLQTTGFESVAHPGARLDALTVAVALESVPSHFLDPCPAAVAAGANALLLLGRTRACVALYQRWSRKQREGSEALSCALCRRTAVGSGAPLASGEHLADVFARAAFHLPRHEAGKWARRLWRDHRRPDALLLQELLVGDTRQTADRLRGTASRASSPPSRSPQASGLLRPIAVPKAERRRLLGMAFCLLDTTPVLRFVLQAAGSERVTAVGVDEHGLQRLLRALPSPTALAAAAQVREAGERVEGVWLLNLLGRTRKLSTGEWASAAALAPLSPLVNAYATLLQALSDDDDTNSSGREVKVDVLLALKAIHRLTELSVTAYRACTDALYSAISSMARHFSERPTTVRALKALSADEQQEANTLAHRILHALVSQRELENRLRRERRDMARLLAEPNAASPVVLLGWLHHALSRHLRVPVGASFTSYLLRVAAVEMRDAMTVFRLFDLIRRPTAEEGVLLLTVLSGSSWGDPTARLQHSPRLLHLNPELVLVWAGQRHVEDDAAQSAGVVEEKLALSRAILSDTAVVTSDEGGRPQYMLSSHTQALVDRWTAADCLRALGILRQMRLLEERSNPDGGATFSLATDDARVKACLHAVERRLRVVASKTGEAKPASGPETS